MLRISVALASYNGEPYLAEQLASLANQTRRPDEVVVTDDQSTDNTLAILHEFAATAPFPVRIVQNDENLGLPHNFERAISLCQGDVIAIADQDDVWLPTKLARAEAVFVEAPQVGAVFSDAEVTDAELKPCGYSIWDTAKFNHQRQQRLLAGEAFPVLLKNNIIQAAALVFRASFVPFILPVPEGWDAGAWAALVVASMADLSIICEPLLKYRQHGRNQIGAQRPTLLHALKRTQKLRQSSTFAQQEDLYVRLYERVAGFDGRSLKPDTLALLEAKITHLHLRANLPKSRFKRLPVTMRELFTHGYHRYSLGGFGSFLSDLLF